MKTTFKGVGLAFGLALALIPAASRASAIQSAAPVMEVAANLSQSSVVVEVEKPATALPSPASLESQAAAPAVPPVAAPVPAAIAAPAAEPATSRKFVRAQSALPPQSVIGKPVQTSEVVRSALILTLAALIPAMVICMTPFVRITVVLSMIRHAFGMPETPPNQVLVSLALFLTAFTMMPTLSAVNERSLQPFMQGEISIQQAMDEGSGPMREFMLRQVHDRDIASVYQIAKKPLPERAAEVGLIELTSAFMLNELRVAFKIGFVILLPFLLIDLVVSAVLLSLGMLMVPPSTISLPIKVLMFVLIDGWSLVLVNVVGSFK